MNAGVKNNRSWLKTGRAGQPPNCDSWVRGEAAWKIWVRKMDWGSGKMGWSWKEAASCYSIWRSTINYKSRSILIKPLKYYIIILFSIMQTLSSSQPSPSLALLRLQPMQICDLSSLSLSRLVSSLLYSLAFLFIFLLFVVFADVLILLGLALLFDFAYILWMLRLLRVNTQMNILNVVGTMSFAKIRKAWFGLIGFNSSFQRYTLTPPE